MPPTYLDIELLDRFESALRGANAAITTTWSPGLSDADIDAATTGDDFTLPEGRWESDYEKVPENVRQLGVY